MKVRNKGKIHPSPSPSPSPADTVFAVLKLLPAAILALASVLSPEDREVLAYMITRSLKSTNPPPQIDNKKQKKPFSSSSNSAPFNLHKPPHFDCECFDCYTSYWFKWDSSSNRELIHQAIEAFEDHLSNGEQSKRGRKKKDKMGRRQFTGKFPSQGESAALPEKEPKIEDDQYVEVFPDNAEEEMEEAEVISAEDVPLPSPEMGTAAAIDHKGLARKVLPDVLGLFNSRLWNLWSPNV